MKSNGSEAKVLAVRSCETTSGRGVLIDGRLVEVSQDHLLGPLVELLESVEQMATVAAAGGDQAAGAERACLAGVYRSTYAFFQTLLPSARHEVIDKLTYSIALLLVGEGIEASRVVAPSPAAGQNACDSAKAGGAGESAAGRSEP